MTGLRPLRRWRLGVLLPPISQGAKKGTKFTSLVGNNIFGSWWMIRVSPALNDTVLLKYLEAVRQGVWTNSRQRALQVVKFARALKNEVAQDQHCPAVADNVERPGHRTVGGVVHAHV